MSNTDFVNCINRYTALGERPIAVLPAYISITGSTSGAILLAQVLWFFTFYKCKEFYKTDRAFCEQTNMGFKELRAAKKKLEDLGLVSITRKGIPAKSYYFLHVNKLDEYIIQYGKKKQEENMNGGEEIALNKEQTRMPKIGKLINKPKKKDDYEKTAEESQSYRMPKIGKLECRKQANLNAESRQTNNDILNDKLNDIKGEEKNFKKEKEKKEITYTDQLLYMQDDTNEAKDGVKEKSYQSKDVALQEVAAAGEEFKRVFTEFVKWIMYHEGFEFHSEQQAVKYAYKTLKGKVIDAITKTWRIGRFTSVRNFTSECEYYSKQYASGKVF